jgi:hypothetical protein
MKEIYKFSGNKTLSELTKEDYTRVKESLIDDDYFDIPIFKRSDFIRAQEEGCKIYCKTFEFDGSKVERYFIRIFKTNVFYYAKH